MKKLAVLLSVLCFATGNKTQQLLVSLSANHDTPISSFIVFLAVATN